MVIILLVSVQMKSSEKPIFKMDGQGKWCNWASTLTLHWPFPVDASRAIKLNNQSVLQWCFY